MSWFYDDGFCFLFFLELTFFPIERVQEFSRQRTFWIASSIWLVLKEVVPSCSIKPRTSRMQIFNLALEFFIFIDLQTSQEHRTKNNNITICLAPCLALFRKNGYLWRHLIFWTKMYSHFQINASKCSIFSRYVQWNFHIAVVEGIRNNIHQGRTSSDSLSVIAHHTK